MGTVRNPSSSSPRNAPMGKEGGQSLSLHSAQGVPREHDDRTILILSSHHSSPPSPSPSPHSTVWSSGSVGPRPRPLFIQTSSLPSFPSPFFLSLMKSHSFGIPLVATLALSLAVAQATASAGTLSSPRGVSPSSTAIDLSFCIALDHLSTYNIDRLILPSVICRGQPVRA